ALAPRVISEACSKFPKWPAITTDAIITAGKAAKIPTKYFEGISCSMIKQIATDAPLNTNLRPRSIIINRSKINVKTNEKDTGYFTSNPFSFVLTFLSHFYSFGKIILYDLMLVN